MKRYMIVFGLLFAVAFFKIESGYAADPGIQWESYVVTAASQQVISGGGKLRKMILSSCTGADYCVAIDTDVMAPGQTPPTLTNSTQTITPHLLFTVYYPTSTTNYRSESWEVGPMEWVRFTRGLFIMKSAAASGGANVCTAIAKPGD